MLRPARPDDHRHFVRLFAELGVDDPVPDAATWAETTMGDTVVLEDGGDVVAYGYGQALAGTGYVRHVAVAPDARRRGHGKTVMLGLAGRFRQAGCREWLLNVRDDNVAALHLYHRLGLRVVFPTSVLRMPWERVPDLPDPGPGVAVDAPGAETDAETEAALDLPSGLLGRNRARGDGTVLRLRAGDDVAGGAWFQPAFPGAMPFRARRPALARALLDAIRPLAPPGVPWVQLVVEDDAPLGDLLLATGARLKMRIVQLQGRLPGS